MTRSSPRRWLAASAIVLAALVVTLVAVSGMSGVDDPAPWCAWAAPTGATFTVVTVTVPQYHDVSTAPGGERLGSEWSAGWMRQGTQPPEPTINWQEPFRRVTRLFGRGKSAGYHAAGVERDGPDGRKWLAFVRSMHPTEVVGGAPDPRCAGTWEVTDDKGLVRSLELRADGSVVRVPIVESPPQSATGAAADDDLWNVPDADARWLVRDGALLILRGGPHGIDVGALAEDAQSFAGRHDGWQAIRGKRVGK